MTTKSIANTNRSTKYCIKQAARSRIATRNTAKSMHADVKQAMTHDKHVASSVSKRLKSLKIMIYSTNKKVQHTQTTRFYDVHEKC